MTGIALAKCQMEQAIKYFDKVLSIDPNNVDVLDKKGKVLFASNGV